MYYNSFIMQTEYIEIVHAEPDTLRKFAETGPRHKAIADRISGLEESVEVKYIWGNLQNDPGLPKDTPIRIGGQEFNSCVRERVEKLIAMGYMNVRADREISFANEDLDADLK